MGCPSKSHQFVASSDPFSFLNHLFLVEEFNAAEPDYFRWIEQSLDLDLSFASEECDSPEWSKEEREAWRLFEDAVRATSELLKLYKSHPHQFREAARRVSFLPCLMSWHPEADRFNRRLMRFSCLGQEGIFRDLRETPRHLLSQSPAVRYAYAIVATIDLFLDTYGGDSLLPDGTTEPEAKPTQKKRLRARKKRESFGILPGWSIGLEDVRRPFNEQHLLDYWHKGKEIILEEMPEFHLRPEWREYANRKYKDGAKKGAIQHAIFKDILVALRTIAGANKGKGRTQK